jgi:hypothetical protein
LFRALNERLSEIIPTAQGTLPLVKVLEALALFFECQICPENKYEEDSQ